MTFKRICRGALALATALGVVAIFHATAAQASPTRQSATHSVKATALCRSFRTKHLLCAGGVKDAGGTITHYQINGSVPSGFSTETFMKASKDTCSSMSFSFFSNEPGGKTIIRVITVNGTFKATEHGTKVKSFTANASGKPFIMRATQFGPRASGHVYMSGVATCRTKSGK